MSRVQTKIAFRSLSSPGGWGLIECELDAFWVASLSQLAPSDVNAPLVSEVDAKADRWGFMIEEVILSQGAAVAETMEVLPCKVLLRTLPLVALSGCTGCRCRDH